MFRRLLLGFLLITCLTGCIGENYSVGHPITTLTIGSSQYELERANVNWLTQGDSTSLNVADIQSFANELKEITVKSSQSLKVSFQDSIEDEGEYTDIQINISATKDGTEFKLYMEDLDSSYLEENHSFQAPEEPGIYILEVQFTSNGNNAQYIGNLVVE